MSLRINPSTLQVENYDDSHYCCSVCHQYYPVESYCRDGVGPRCRTNCESCYNLPVAEWDILKQKIEENLKSSTYYLISSNLREYLRLQNCGTDAHEFANRLLKLPKGSVIYVKEYQEGYHELTAPYGPSIDTDLIGASLTEFIKLNNLEALPQLYQIA